MDHVKIGQLIYKLRKEKGLTQLQVAKQLNVSDKTISKWERGLGCPDVSLLAGLSKLFEVDLEKLLSGELKENVKLGGNMRKMLFYVCPTCGNIITSIAEVNSFCCGKKLTPLLPQKAAESERLSVELIENDYFITSEHPMTREHYITFVALLSGDSIMLRKQYPEWNLQVRIPKFARGRLLWYCSEHGLFYQEVR